MKKRYGIIVLFIALLNNYIEAGSCCSSEHGSSAENDVKNNQMRAGAGQRKLENEDLME
ncbi:MAG: hypothetical protein WA432_01930 [Candidatus Babeliaceae bacterium]